MMESPSVKAKKITKTEVAKKLGISRQSLYYRKKRPELDKELKRQIEAVLGDNPAYGHRRIALELKLNRKRILRVMRKFNLKPYRRVLRKLRKKEDEGRPALTGINISKLLCPIRPNVVWVSDFTYVKYRGRFIYLATIMDRYTREIMGFSVSRYHDQNLVMEAFLEAERRTGLCPVYLHSDQGSEYLSRDYREYVLGKQIILSFADKGSPWQNGFQESFYGKFKVDLGEVDRFETLGELIEAIYQTVYYYNHKRKHTSLKMSPVEFKLLYQKRSVGVFV